MKSLSVEVIRPTASHPHLPRAPVPANDTKVSLLWLKQTSPLYRHLAKVVIREVCVYLADCFLFNTWEHYIRRFNIFTGTWGELCSVKSFIPDLRESRFLALDSSNFLLLNQNGTGLKCPLCVFVEMYVLHTDGDIYQAYVLPKMQRDRFNAGLLYFKGSVYAFRGTADIDGPIDEEMAHSAEALSVNSTAPWRALACTMRHQKLSLVPCLYLNKAYLYSYSANVIEILDMYSETVQGEVHTENLEGVATTAFIVDGNFIVIAMNVYVLFDLKAENKSPTDVFYAKNAVSECVRRYTIRRMTF